MDCTDGCDEDNCGESAKVPAHCVCIFTDYVEKKRLSSEEGDEYIQFTLVSVVESVCAIVSILWPGH